MNRQKGFAPIIIIAVVAVVAVVGGGAYYFTKQKEIKKEGVQDQKQEIQEQKSSSSSVDASNPFAKWLSELNAGKSIVCTTKDKETGSVMTSYMKGKKVKISGTGIGNGEAKEGYMINDGTYAYMWSKGEKTGMKIKIPSPEEQKQIQKEAQEFVEKNKALSQEGLFEQYKDPNISIDCKAAGVSDSEFTPPTNIEFTNPEEMMKNFQGSESSVDTEEFMKSLKDIKISIPAQPNEEPEGGE